MSQTGHRKLVSAHRTHSLRRGRDSRLWHTSGLEWTLNTEVTRVAGKTTRTSVIRVFANNRTEELTAMAPDPLAADRETIDDWRQQAKADIRKLAEEKAEAELANVKLGELRCHYVTLKTEAKIFIDDFGAFLDKVHTYLEKLEEFQDQVDRILGGANKSPHRRSWRGLASKRRPASYPLGELARKE